MNLNVVTPAFQSTYFSYLLNCQVLSVEGKSLGRLKELYVLNAENSRVVACQVKSTDGSSLFLDWEEISTKITGRTHQIICREQKSYNNIEERLALGKQILDQQIIDINDKKVVRVNDIHLAALSSGVFAVAVDVGLSGLLRRLGVIEITNVFLSFIKRSVPGRLILWNDIGVLLKPSQQIKLSVSAEKLNHLHPSDLSDIIEDLDAQTRTAVFSALDQEKAADVLEEMEEEAKVSLVEDLPVGKAAEVLERMPSDEVADILDVVSEEHAEKLLGSMDSEISEEVRDLMEYPEESVGSIMSTDFVSLDAEVSVEKALAKLRELKPEGDTIYSVYLTDSANKLLGAITLPALVTADLNQRLSDIGDRGAYRIRDTEDLATLMELVAKYALHAVPVVDEHDVILGVIQIEDVFYRLFRNTKPNMSLL